eukprot:scaffold1919_cov19-Prasinocladus_malaysianus.AAC.1
MRKGPTRCEQSSAVTAPMERPHKPMVDAILCSLRCSITTCRDNEERVSSQLSHNLATDVRS